MAFNPNFLSESIQLSVAPVFLLTAVAGMISALTHRIARVIDRSRSLQFEIISEKSLEHQLVLKQFHQEELIYLSKRANLVNISMALLVLCAIRANYPRTILCRDDCRENEYFRLRFIYLYWRY